MKVTVERSGGFAGITTTFSADDATLTPSEKQQVDKLMESSKINKGTTSNKDDNKGAADYFVYRITVEKDDGNSQTLEVNDMTMDASLRSIIKSIEDKSRDNNSNNIG